MAVSDIKIIKIGTLALDWFEPPGSHVIGMKYLCGIGGGSTVTFLRSDANILVDTGFDYECNLSDENIRNNHKRLIHALKDAGLSSEDIDILFITHWHSDHFMNLGIFSDCEVVMLKEAVERHNLDFNSVASGERIAGGVEILSTPGHTKDHASLLVKTEQLRYFNRSRSGGMIMGIGSVNVVVGGDAVVSPACYCNEEVWHHNQDFFSEEIAMASMRKIQEVADFIIPGHGGIFWNARKGESNVVK